jgi:hypothetical protein
MHKEKLIVCYFVNLLQISSKAGNRLIDCSTYRFAIQNSALIIQT